jgi:hypothetical protein
MFLTRRNENYGRYAVIGWSHDSERENNGCSDMQMLQRFINVVENQDGYNEANEINAIPVIIYHDVDATSEFYTADLELFKSEMRYL